MQLPRATFVTLRHRRTHDLRGCRGEVFARSPLWQSVQQVSILSATDDPRFPHDEGRSSWPTNTSRSAC